MKSFLFVTLLLLAQVTVLSQESARGTKTVSTNTTTGRNFALVMGISDYKDFEDLDFADNDAMSFHEFLVKHPDFKADDVHLLRNEEVTEQNFKEKLIQIYKEIKEGDKLYLYFAGHGDVPKSAEYGYLLFYDADPEGTYNFGGAISTTDLREFMEGFWSKGAQIVLIVDACRTAKLADLGRKSTLNALQAEWPETLKLLACAPSELAYEYSELKHGVFTYYLIEGLSGAAKDIKQNDIYDDREIHKYVSDKVSSKTELDQNPQLVGGGSLVSIIPVKMDLSVDASATSSSKRGRGSIENYPEELQKMVGLLEKGESLAPIQGAVSKAQFSNIQSKEYSVHTDVSYSIAYSFMNGNVYAGSGKDKRIAVYDLSTQQVSYIKDEVGGIMSLAADPAGKFLAYGNWVDYVRVRSLEDGKLVKDLKGNAGDVRALSFSDDGNYLISGDYNGNLITWHTNEDFQQLIKIKGHAGIIADVLPFGDNRYISAGQDGYVKFWNVGEKKPYKSIKVGSKISAIALTSNQQSILIGHGKSTLSLWTIADGKQVFSSNLRKTNINDIQLSPDGKFLAVVGKDRDFSLHKVQDGGMLTPVSGSSRGITAVAFNGTGSQLFSTNYGGKLTHFALSEDKPYAYDEYLNNVLTSGLSADEKEQATYLMVRYLERQATQVISAFINGTGDTPSLGDVKEAQRKLDVADRLLGEQAEVFKKKLEMRKLSLLALEILAANEVDRFDEAIGYFEKIQEMDQNAIYTQNGISLIEKSRNELEKAKSALQVAIDEIPVWTEPKSNLGKSLVLEGRYEDAEIEFDKIIALQPEIAKGYASKGDMYTLMGKFRSALAEYNTALTYEPNHASANYQTASIYLQNGDLSKAGQYLKSIPESNALYHVMEAKIKRFRYEYLHPNEELLDEIIASWSKAYDLNANDREVVNEGLRIAGLVPLSPSQKQDELKEQLSGVYKQFPFDPEMASLSWSVASTEELDPWFTTLKANLNGNAQFKTYYARYLDMTKRGQSAAGLYDQVQSMDPYRYDAALFSLENAIATGNEGRASEIYEMIESQFPEEVAGSYTYASLNPDQNANLLRQLVQKQPTNYFAVSLNNTLKNPVRNRLNQQDFSRYFKTIEYVQEGIYKVSFGSYDYFLGKDLTYIARLNPDDTYLGGGLFLLEESGLFGIKDLLGNEVITPQYEKISILTKEVLVVYNGQYYGLTNFSGESVLPLKYDDISVLAPGLIRVKLFGKTAVYDVKGNAIVPAGTHRIFLTKYKRRKVIAADGRAYTFYYTYDGKCLNCNKRKRKR